MINFWSISVFWANDCRFFISFFESNLFASLFPDRINFFFKRDINPVPLVLYDSGIGASCGWDLVKFLSFVLVFFFYFLSFDTDDFLDSVPLFFLLLAATGDVIELYLLFACADLCNIGSLKCTTLVWEADYGSYPSSTCNLSRGEGQVSGFINVAGGANDFVR